MTPIAVKIHVEFKIWTKICLTDLSACVDLIDSLVTHHIQVAEIDVLETIRKHYFVKTSLLKKSSSETQSNEIQVIVLNNS